MERTKYSDAIDAEMKNFDIKDVDKISFACSFYELMTTAPGEDFDTEERDRVLLACLREYGQMKEALEELNKLLNSEE